ncbi:MAG: hypothetical protein KJZ86_19125 [Caldilineaceae bacterium]|nr:hypothetical protein [Caldilineaceae bacterium]HRJ40255.1 hypothetical protein [Caldilineaceae bacterium]
MTNNKTNPQGGSWNLAHIVRDIAITWQLMGDPQVSGLLKLSLPVFAFLYWLSPIDLLVGMPFDDIAVFVLASRFFVQLAPPAAVERARRRLGRFGGYTQQAPPPSDQPDKDVWDVWDDDSDGKTISGDWRVVDD